MGPVSPSILIPVIRLANLVPVIRLANLVPEALSLPREVGARVVLHVVVQNREFGVAQ